MDQPVNPNKKDSRSAQIPFLQSCPGSLIGKQRARTKASGMAVFEGPWKAAGYQG